jgi:hypothetical protein
LLDNSGLLYTTNSHPMPQRLNNWGYYAPLANRRKWQQLSSFNCAAEGLLLRYGFLASERTWLQRGFFGRIIGRITPRSAAVGGFKMIHKHLVTIGLALLLIGCQTVEQTGRSQFIIASESQELQLGDQAHQETLKKNLL